MAVIADCLSAVCSTLFSMSPRGSLLGLSESSGGLCQVLALAIVFFACRLACDPTQIADLLRFVVIALGATLGYAVLQSLALDPLAWADPSMYANHLRRWQPLVIPMHWPVCW